ncbi:MAG TPA: T9SS type A sorting domain-containing protein [Flavobacteriales bacterium]|nr:T9SS type A sorting domain-containing protein [Flavobacteriales bacterium]
MKKIATLTALILTCGLSQAQTYNYCTGTITDCLGAPVAGHPVYISVDSMSGVFYYNTVYTNASGVYIDSIPYDTFIGGTQPIYIATMDPAPATGYYCANESPTSAGNTYVHDFSVACGSSPACSVAFSSWEDSTGVNDTTYISLTYATSDPSDTTVTWDFGDGSPYITGFSPTHVYASAGTYYVCAMLYNATDSCSATYCDWVADVFRSGFVLQVVDMMTLGIADNNKFTDVKIYPNPAQNELFISSIDLDEVSTIVVYDIAGRPVGQLNKNDMHTNVRIYLSGIENGSYIVTLLGKNNNALYTHPIIKQ